ncbi:DUF3800 domain-containing protein [Pseudomonas aeruginosa]|uniref:DUF3800 domain-containing protein n=1 Tax=Pseudomonas aeruginosa TaxID=287 RepID=UPI0009390346|nr:DUF3800 domain-containing protein [Pseudomonas aeruginosa]MBW6289788.1 DUF3800 domain-containing protein [Pseudomonas aeruginosa]MBY9839238.1 DUF3800 domain-containing protein [Pseudomonas aeruginosa]MCV0233875.1 DUF3800 domain-containing protein [Pseudomonas aeruginosa]MDS9677355.1 DUF3800 domain-containing protein [Pseudomonas aeruginosa]MDY1056628.1 DUF3800 domain-containing protein [Pseudomonas aeruginosa]
MYIFYMDDSGESGIHTFTALGVHSRDWREVFAAVKEFRTQIRKHAGIYMNKELHATKFISGRGRPSDRHVDLAKRERIFAYALRTLSKLGPEKLMLFNVVNRNQEWAYERILNRINRTMEARDDHAIIISDEGKEGEYTRLVRRMGAYNPIPSAYGEWDEGAGQSKNIPISRVIEDPIFRNSEASYLIQMVDFCAYALLRKEIPNQNRPTLSDHFQILEPICFKAASKGDPFGIIR